MTDKKIAPIGFGVLLELTQQGIAPTNIIFKNVTLQSNKYICVREEGKNSVAIIDTATKNMLRLPVAVDSAIMNPVSKVVALRAGTNLQIYNLEMKTKMKATTIEANVVFWKWLDAKTIAIVTDTAVFHWSMDGDEQPVKMFDRATTEGPVQIINYRASADGKWLLLGGITQTSTGQVAGVLQVYSVDIKASQPTMDAHAATFAQITVDGRTTPSNVFCFTKKDTPQGPRIICMEVGVPKDQAFTANMAMKLEDGDFPVSMLPDNKHGSLWITTKGGYLYLYEIQSGKMIFGSKASAATMFASCESDDAKAGIVSVDQTGRVTHFYMDEKTVVKFVCDNMNDYDLGVALARRYNLQGAENIFKQQFGRLMQAGKLEEAMNLAVTSPQGILRTIETINALKQYGQGQGLLQYFQLLLKAGKLNAVESIELARPVMSKNPQQGMEHIKGWLKEQKLEPSEELGDLLKNYDLTLALSVYLRAKVPEKVIGCFLSLAAAEQDEKKAAEHLNNIIAYAKRVTFNPDYPILVQQLLRVNRDRAKDFALILLKQEEGPKLDVNSCTDMFMHHGDVKNTTAILLEWLRPRGDREEDAALQTRLLEINLLSNPQVADVIMESPECKFTHYDRLKVAQLCERAGLFQRALEHYTDLADIKRVLSNTHVLDPNFLLEFFGRMTPANCLECLRDLLKYNLQQNIRLVVEVAKKWNDYLTPDALIALFEEFKSYNGLYFYLGSFVNYTDKKAVVFKYIEAATKLNMMKEVERVCRENEHYEAKEVKEFLLGQNLKDPRPLIHVCDRFGFIEELTQYLYNNQLFVFIEAYVQRMNPKAAPAVVGSLLDLNCNEEQVKKLMDSVRPPSDDVKFIENLVAQVEKRNRLKLMRGWLEARAQEGSENPHLHNGLAKIYVDLNLNPQQFLTTNKFYDSKVVGKYCEARDPHLSFVAYKRAWGTCDQELIDVTNKNGFFRDQARYLVERQDADLWARVLEEKNEFRRQLIDQVVATALPESRVPEEVSNTVKAFMAANLPNELIELLERIILHGPADGEFQTNKNLQNLLILTAIKADKKRVMDYIKRLDNYDGPDIAKIAISDQYKLYEEAFFIYKKFKKGPESIQVLLENLNSIERATEFAEYWDQPDVWSLLAKAQLDANLVKESIKSFLKADDASHFQDVINSAKHEDLYEQLIQYLKMARGKAKEAMIDNELIYCYAKTNRLADMEEFIAQPNAAKLSDCGEQCFTEGLYEAAKILFTFTNNNARLAVVLVKLKQFNEAVDAARKANSIPTWKAVCFACVDAQKFRQAQMCGINIIVYMDHLTELIAHYENAGYFDEVIQLMEQGINLDRAHQGIYTQLGILYAKYREDKLMEHIKLFWSRLNIPSLLEACKQNLHWTEAVFLFSHYDQYDQAVDVLMSHSAECWKHDLFKETISHVSNTEVFYRAIDFYLSEHPLLLNDLLMDMVTHLDHARVVHKLKDGNFLPLVTKYLLHVQRDNISAVNEALNAMFVAEENYKALRESIDGYNQFDQISLGLQLEKHELLEFRRISAYLFKMNKKYERAIELSKKDKMWADAMDTTNESKDQALAEKLLYWFVEIGEKECYAACLYTCYELIRADVVLETAWRFNLMNYAMPFMVQCLREYDDRLNTINARLEAQDKEAQDKKAAESKNQQPPVDMHMHVPLALMPPMPTPGTVPGVMPMMGGGMPMPMNPVQHFGGAPGFGPL